MWGNLRPGSNGGSELLDPVCHGVGMEWERMKEGGWGLGFLLDGGKGYGCVLVIFLVSGFFARSYEAEWIELGV